MRLEILDNIIILYISNLEKTSINFDKIDEVEEYFRNILLRLKEYYYIEVKGAYKIMVYTDKKEGMVFHLEKEEGNYYDTIHQLEIRMLHEETTFFYEVEDPFSLSLDTLDIYLYQDKIYVKRKTDEKEYRLYEFGRVIYENTNRILNNGKKVTIY